MKLGFPLTVFHTASLVRLEIVGFKQETFSSNDKTLDSREAMA